MEISCIGIKNNISTSEQSTYDEYRNSLRLGAPRIESQETLTYYKRKFAESIKRREVFEKKIGSFIWKTKRTSEERKLLCSFLNTYKKQLGYARNYGVIYSVVTYDEKAYLELAGITTYKKNFSAIIDLSGCIDVILAFIAGDNVIDVRLGIEEVCKKYGMSYNMFSRAWTTLEPDLIGAMKIEMFYEITDKVKLACKKILNSRATIASQPHMAGIDVFPMGSAQFLQVALQAQIQIDMQYILSSCIEQYAKYKVKKYEDILLVSKGLTTLVFESNVRADSLQFDVWLGTIGRIIIKPIICTSIEYLESIISEPPRQISVS